MSGLVMALRIARRELRGGLRGFRIFIACLVLGVAAIATVQSVAHGLLESLRADGRAILGGDVAVRQLYRPVTPEQRAWLEATGIVSRGAEMRAMARADDASRSTLVELKAVDDLYPLYGTLVLRSGGDLHDALARRDGAWGTVLEEGVLQRLGLAVGDTLHIGDLAYVIRGVIEREPDRAGSGVLSLGPRVMVHLDSLPATGLIQPGSMIYWTYRLALQPGLTAADWRAGLAAAFPEAGWRVSDFTDAAPQLRRFITRLSLFLTLVGLTALLVGGVGVGNAVRAYLDGKIATIATLKCLGAPGWLIFRAYLLQVLALATASILVGLAIGALGPVVLGALLGDLLPVTARLGVYPGALAVAAAFGLLTALTFSLWPIGRAREIPAASLFRDLVTPATTRPRAGYVLATALAGLALAGLAVATAEDRPFAAIFVAGALAALVAFRGAAGLVTTGSRRLGRPRHPGLRLALANLHRPGNPTASVVLSLGLGLTVLVAIALIEGNFASRIQDELPEDAPSFFFIDIQPDQRARFAQTVLSVPGTRDLREVPMLRGRITRVRGVPAEAAVVNPEHAWVLRGDRGLTYSAPPPPNTQLLAGEWWPEDHQGPPLVSIHQDIAAAFDLKVGETLTVNVLGRDITAEVASIRLVDFSTMEINFTLVFSPGVLEAAPHTILATVQAPPAAEPEIQRRIAAQFPNVTAVRVSDALETVNALLVNIATAVRVTAAITLLAGTLVLAGAVAAGHRRRVYDAVVLKVLGATRGDVLRAFLLEYGLLGVITAAIAGGLGTLAAWAVMIWLMEWDWVFLPAAVVSTALLCTAITLAFGFVGTWRALGQPAAPLLRND